MIKILKMNTIDVDHPDFKHTTFVSGETTYHRIRLCPEDIATIEIYQKKYKSHALILCVGNCEYRYITRHMVDENEFVCVEIS